MKKVMSLAPPTQGILVAEIEYKLADNHYAVISFTAVIFKFHERVSQRHIRGSFIPFRQKIFRDLLRPLFFPIGSLPSARVFPKDVITDPIGGSIPAAEKEG
jgi:hypothetical protein